jgi:hypothetical protein
MHWGEKASVFFFEKKKQKTFVPLACAEYETRPK